MVSYRVSGQSGEEAMSGVSGNIREAENVQNKFGVSWDETRKSPRRNDVSEHESVEFIRSFDQLCPRVMCSTLWQPRSWKLLLKVPFVHPVLFRASACDLLNRGNSLYVLRMRIGRVELDSGFSKDPVSAYVCMCVHVSACTSSRIAYSDNFPF